jgi:hypothetical protein
MTMPNLTPDQDRARRKRNNAIGMILLAFVALIFIVTIVRLGENVVVRPL